MTRRSWLVGHEEAGRRRADRAAGRVHVHEWEEVWAPPVYRSVHMRPAETQHIPEDRRDSMLGRSLDWLISLMP